MFTGIITDMGEVLEVEQRGDLRARIGTGYDISRHRHRRLHRLRWRLPDGHRQGHRPARLVRCGNLGRNRQQDRPSARRAGASGHRLNLERALKVGDELGGHIVSGHVDGVAEVVGLRPEGDSLRVTFRAPRDLAGFIAPKGSVALNGTSLTVNEVEGTDFGVNFIPHTQSVTTWGGVGPGTG
jgi:riboflavin synthase